MTIQAAEIDIDRKEAKRLYREYKAHASFDTKMDREIRRAYQLIAQGKTVIDARQSIANAGYKEDGYPKLAIARATTKTCFLRMEKTGPVSFKDIVWPRSDNQHIDIGQTLMARSPLFDLPKNANEWRFEGQALVPPIPAHLRPKKALDEYHILWEAQWKPIPPVDPLLLRRIGKSDMWLVVAGWDLTAVERAAMSSRM